MSELNGRTALVTGAARGIGAAIASALAEAGAAVAVNYAHSRDKAESVVAGIEAAGGRAVAVAADVADEDAVEAMMREVDEALGPPDVVVNNAGIIDQRRTAETSAADFDRVIAVNLRGTFLVGRAAIRRMQARGGGRIINLASDLGYLGRAEFTAYCASKGAILALTRSWARELAPEILVNAIAPGPVATDMLTPENMTPEWLEKEKDIPLARFGEPEEIARSAVFLAGAGGTFMTGQAIGPNGGSVMP